MPSIDGIVFKSRSNPKNIRFSELTKVCTALIGPLRATAGSHLVFQIPWEGDPRINIQNRGGFAKPYQVKQVLAAIEKMGS